VAALAAVNAIGNLIGLDGRLVAGSPVDAPRPSPGNTTLGVLATNAPLDRAQCRKLAELGHDALALAISPVHTMFDGDVVFALSTAPSGAERLDPAEFTRVGVAAVEALREAILRSVERPEG
jgi:L-aminopeptidase/D-esterase-like protein